MIDTTKKIYTTGKRSLDSLLRERAYTEVQEHLQDKGIDINSVADDDIENLVAAKVLDMTNTLKGVGVGLAFSIAFSLFTGGL